MEIVLAAILTLFATFGAAGMVIYYFETRQEFRLRHQLLLSKRLEVVSHLVATMGRIKAALEYPNSDQTLRQWKQQLVAQLQEMRGEAFQWEFFLPPEVRHVPYDYISQIMQSLDKLESVNGDANALHLAVEIMSEVKLVEQQASQRLQQGLQQSLN